MKLLNLLLKYLTLICLIIVLWSLSVNISGSSMDRTTLILPLTLTGLLMSYVLLPKSIPVKISLILKRPRVTMILILALVLISILLRFAFLSLDYQPVSDPGTFYDKSYALSQDGVLSAWQIDYVSRFPYVYAYDYLLSLSMNIFGPGLQSVIILNTIFDLISAGFLYLLILLISRSKKAAIAGFLLWMTNPFNIIFSALSLPIIVVNTLIITSLLSVYVLVMKIRSTKLTVPLSLLTGILLALANFFRPFMIIFIIAIAIYLALHLLEKFDTRKAINSTVAIIMIIFTFTLLNQIYIHSVSSAIKSTPAQSSGGWSIYVGSNTATSGSWNAEDKQHQDLIFENSDSYTEAHDTLKRDGLERYSSLSIKQLILLMFDKARVLMGDHNTAVYNLRSYPEVWESDELKNFIHSVNWIYVIAILALTIRYFKFELKPKPKPKLHFTSYIALITVGLFLSLLLVEVSRRYFTPFYIPLTIFSALTLAQLISKNQSKSKVSKITP